MAVTQNFRSAFNGFNREDVVRYIEYINAKHTEELNQLRSEVEFLQEKLNTPDPETAQLLTEAEAARDEYKKQLDEVLAAKEEQETAPDTAPSADVQTLEAKIASLQKELDAARNTSITQYRVEQELEAYRRAERTERIARERAEQVYRTTNGVLADATVRVDEAAARISEMTDQVMLQLNLLQSAVTGSKQALKDAAATMYAIRPGSTEE